MIAEAIEKIEWLVRTSNQNKIYDGSDICKVIVKPDGDATPIVRQRVMNLGVNDLDSLVRSIHQYAETGATVWIDDDSIVAVLDDIEAWKGYDLPENDGSAYVIPAASPRRTNLIVEMNRLLNQGTWPTSGKSQQLFYQALAYNFAGASFDVDLKPLVRTMRWSTHDESNSELRQGSDAMGRSVRREVSGTAGFPEYVTVAFPAFEAPVVGSIGAKITAQFVVDTANKSLGLVPLPGEIERAKREALDALRAEVVKRLRHGEWESHTFLGQPGV